MFQSTKQLTSVHQAIHCKECLFNLIHTLKINPFWHKFNSFQLARLSQEQFQKTELPHSQGLPPPPQSTLDMTLCRKHVVEGVTIKLCHRCQVPAQQLAHSSLLQRNTSWSKSSGSAEHTSHWYFYFYVRAPMGKVLRSSISSFRH